MHPTPPPWKKAPLSFPATPPPVKPLVRGSTPLSPPPPSRKGWGCTLWWNNLIRAKTISPLTFFFFISFLLITSKAATRVVLQKKQSLELLEYAQEKVLETLSSKVTGLQDCRKTYLLYLHLRFYFSLGKTLKNFINFS